MLIGITIDRYKGINPSVFLRLARKINLNFVEITKNIFDDLPNVISELGSTKTGFHLPNFGDHGYDFSCLDFTDKINQLITLINKHQHNLNIQYCLSHPPECPSTSSAKNCSLSFLFENLKKVELPIVLENVAGLNQGQFKNFYSQAKAELGVKLIGQCYDAPHYFTSGIDPISILENLDGDINNIIKSVHLSDCKSDKDSHLPFGLGGELPVEDILNILKNKNYNGIINLELLPRSLSDIDAVLKSYLKVLRTFNKPKYFITKLKLLFYMPVLRRVVRK